MVRVCCKAEVMMRNVCVHDCHVTLESPKPKRLGKRNKALKLLDRHETFTLEPAKFKLSKNRIARSKTLFLSKL